MALCPSTRAETQKIPYTFFAPFAVKILAVALWGEFSQKKFANSDTFSPLIWGELK
jgi:hypothetical protein